MEAAIERQLASLRDQFPDRFSESQWREIREDLEQLAQAASTLRRWSLRNGDEPDIIFLA